MRSKAGKMAAAGSGVLVLAVGLGLGSTGAGAATDANFANARTQGTPAGVFGATWGFPMSGIGITFRTGRAVNVEFRVNGQSFGGGAFTVPSVFGNVYDPSSANASSAFCTGCTTTAIAITVDVVSGPVSSVIAPTNAVVNLYQTNQSNALAADYTFVVSPGGAAALTPSALSQLYGIAGQLTADANSSSDAAALAGEVIDDLNEIAAILSTGVATAAAPAAHAALTPQIAGPSVNVQKLGSIQYQTS